jgi:hypothetical protein
VSLLPDWEQLRAQRISCALHKSLAEQSYNFAGLGVAAKLGLLENRRTIAKHLEPSAARRDQLHLFTRKCLTNFSRQTDGAWFVVSDRAVFDRDHQSGLAPRIAEVSVLILSAVRCDALLSLIDVE